MFSTQNLRFLCDLLEIICSGCDNFLTEENEEKATRRITNLRRLCFLLLKNLVAAARRARLHPWLGFLRNCSRAGTEHSNVNCSKPRLWFARESSGRHRSPRRFHDASIEVRHPSQPHLRHCQTLAVGRRCFDFGRVIPERRDDLRRQADA